MQEEYEKIDNELFARLIKEAVAKNDYSDATLGRYVDILVQIVLKGETFVAYTDDWKLEAYAAACHDVLMAMPNAKPDPSNPAKIFNYLYTVAFNKAGHVMDELSDRMQGEMELNERSKGSLEPFYVRNRKRLLNQKRRETKGMFEESKDEVFECVRKNRLPDIKGVIGRACRKFAEGLSASRLEKLINLSRKGKELYA